MGLPRPPPLWGMGLRCFVGTEAPRRFGTTEAPPGLGRGPRPLSDYRVPAALGPPRHPPLWGRPLLCFGSTCTLSALGRGLCSFGTTRAPASLVLGSSPLWDHQGPLRIEAGTYAALDPTGSPLLWCGACAALGLLTPPPQLVRGLRCLRTTGAPGALGRAPPPLWAPRGPRRVGAGASVTSRSVWPPPPWYLDLRSLGTTRAHALLGLGPSPPWDHRSPCRAQAGASATSGPPRQRRFGWGLSTLRDRWGPTPSFRRPVALGPPGPPQLWGDGLRGFGAAEAAVAFAGCRLWTFEAPAALGIPRPPPVCGGGLRQFRTIEAPAALARGPPRLRDHMDPFCIRQWPLLFWDHCGPCLFGVGVSAALGRPAPSPPLARASAALGPPGLPPLWDYRCPIALRHGPPPLWGHPCSRFFGTTKHPRLGARTSACWGSPRPPPRRGGGPRSLVTTGVCTALVRRLLPP